MGLLANVKAAWESGSLLFKTLAGATILKLDADTGRAVMPGNRVIAKVALTAGNTNAYAFAWQNPEASKIVVERVLVRLATAGGTATSVLDVGVVANATSTSDTLIDGLDLNTTGLFDNIVDKGTNGKARQLVDEKGGTNDYVTGKILVANAAAVVGDVYIVYFTV